MFRLNFTQQCINFIAATFFLRKNTQAQSCLIICLFLAKLKRNKAYTKTLGTRTHDNEKKRNYKIF